VTVGYPSRSRGPDDLDDEQRARIRRQVLQTVRPRHLTLSDRVFEVFSILAIPAPHIVRAAVAAAVIVSIVGTATVASADALPDEPLYAVKLAGEQVRLALAATPQDRAAVQLSMAEHRLSEAERLALAGNEADALVATSAYGTHLATAAAELAAVERLDVAAKPVVDQLKQRLAQQQQRAADLVVRLVSDPTTSAGAPVFETVASFAPELPSGASVAEGIAAHAAIVAGQLAAVAERLAEQAARAEEQEEKDAAPPAADPPRATPRPTDAPRVAAAPERPPARATPTPTEAAAAGGTDAKPAATPKATPQAVKPATDAKKASDAARATAEKAKAEAEKAKNAAEKAKEAAAKTATPKPNRKP